MQDLLGENVEIITFNEIKAEKSAKFDKNPLKVFLKMFKPLVSWYSLLSVFLYLII